MQKFKMFLEKYRNLVVCTVCFLGMIGMLFVEGITFSVHHGDASTRISIFEAILGQKIVLEDFVFGVGNAQYLYLALSIIALCSFALLVCTYLIIKEKKAKIPLFSISIFVVILTAVIFLLAPRIIQVTGNITKVDGTRFDANGEWFLYVFYISFALVYCITIFSELFTLKKYSIREISETAVLISLAIVLDKFASIKINADGGSINFSAIPLFIIAIRYGYFKGFVASSIIFGVMSCILDGYGFQTYPFDYFIAFAGYGLVGVFYSLGLKISEKTSKNKLFFAILGIAVSYIPVTFVRYCGGMLSGYFLYETDFIPNFIYQSTYIPLSAVVSIGAACMLLPIIMKLNKIYPAYTIAVEEDEKKEELEK